MIDLRQSLNEAIRNLATWRMKYPSNIYPHKIVLNMMYRAYSTRIVYESFEKDEMAEFDNFEDSIKYVLHFYGESALREVHPNLESWMSNNPNEDVGTLCTARYESLACSAVNNKQKLEELEFSYTFELLNDMSVLFYIALRLTGLSDVDAIAQMSGVIIEKLSFMDYTITKQVFQQLLVSKFMHFNYKPLP